jgi:NAD(P)H-dependent flavin oxidoreductase YrpB (nitropropane dioxygenase family)
MDLIDRLGIEHPILQSGMTGGLATAELCAAVSRAGALGAIGILPAAVFAEQLSRAADRAGGRPIAANLLLPFTRAAHVDVVVAARVRAVVLFYGFRPDIVRRLHDASILVLHQVGTADEARRAIADGADALVAQGVEAGGHLLGVEPREATLPRILEAANGAPVVAAGGIATARDVSSALGQGAAAVMCGSRFLLTEESGAHPAYKQRVLGATRTIVTRLFGMGWAARHRVVPNGATERWCDADGGEPAAIGLLQRATEGILQRLPPSSRAPGGMAARQRTWLPLYSPVCARPGMSAGAVEVTPLYAGVGVRDIHQIVPAAQAVAELVAPGVWGCPPSRPVAP